MSTATDYAPSGLRLEGAFENDRNAESSECFKSVIREAFGVADVIIAHHLVYVIEEVRDDGFNYTTVEEIPSADTLIFDHDIARKVWGDKWQDCLTRLALEPRATRDALFSALYHGRDAK